MKFTDVEIAARLAQRSYGYVRDNVYRIWTPGAGSVQQGTSREICGAMFLEADAFFEAGLVSYLLRTHLRKLHSSTWASIVTYYASYFAATSFIRLHMHAVSHLEGGALFEVQPGAVLGQFEIKERTRALRHREVWNLYYALVTEMGWPDQTICNTLAPSAGSLRFREQGFRDRMNYRAGEGFLERNVGHARYWRDVRTSLLTAAPNPEQWPDEAYGDHVALLRLGHVAMLLRRLRAARLDSHREEEVWAARRLLVERYASDAADRKGLWSFLKTENHW